VTGPSREVAATVAVAALAGLGAWAVGVAGVQSAVVAAVVATVGAGHSLLSRSEPAQGSLRRRHQAARQGTRHEVTRLSWTLTGRQGVVATRTVQRLRVLAERRLAHLGVDVADPRHAGAASALLGEGAYSVLIADPSQPVGYRAFVRCVAAVERLDDPPAPAVPGGGATSHGGR
jgi:hypothetical protein